MNYFPSLFSELQYRAMKLAHNVKISEHNILNATTYSILTSYCNFHSSSVVIFFYLSKILCGAKKKKKSNNSR